MNICYIGAGFVGACSAAVAADSGHTVLVYDIDARKIDMLGSGDRGLIESSLFEDGLGDLLIRHKERINFTSDYTQVESFLENCDAIFMCLPTPEIGETGESNLEYYFSAAEKLALSLIKRNEGKQNKHVVLVNKSTVPIDMVDKSESLLQDLGVKNYGIVSNPEFLVEGKAIAGSLKPDRIVIGAWKEEDFSIMRAVYQRFYDSPTTQYIEVNPKEAAAGKLLANYYLFNKVVVCFDVIGRTAEAFENLKFENLRRILTTDERIGSWGFYDSLYVGGSCLIKDARSLAHQLQDKGVEPVLVNETYLANKRQLELFLSRLKTDANQEWKNKIVALVGLAFKRDTNDIRNSPSLEIVKYLKNEGVKEIRLYDPAAMEYFRQVHEAGEKIIYLEHEFAAVQGADIIIIAADWPQFRGLADMIKEGASSGAVVMDGRRMLQHRYEDLVGAGFKVIAVGSPYMAAV